MGAAPGPSVAGPTMRVSEDVERGERATEMPT
jgi:hypothetical protein